MNSHGVSNMSSPETPNGALGVKVLYVMINVAIELFVCAAVPSERMARVLAVGPLRSYRRSGTV